MKELGFEPKPFYFINRQMLCMSVKSEYCMEIIHFVHSFSKRIVSMPTAQTLGFGPVLQSQPKSVSVDHFHMTAPQNILIDFHFQKTGRSLGKCGVTSGSGRSSKPAKGQWHAHSDLDLRKRLSSSCGTVIRSG